MGLNNLLSLPIHMDVFLMRTGYIIHVILFYILLYIASNWFAMFFGALQKKAVSSDKSNDGE